MLDVPSRTFGDGPELCQNEDGHQHLENDDHLPVPLAERFGVLGAGEVDPVGDEGADGVEHLPK